MSVPVQWLRGTSAQNSAYTGASGEITIDTDQHAIRVHDGSTAGGYAFVPNDIETPAGYSITFTATDTTSLTLPTSGTLATQGYVTGLAGSASPGMDGTAAVGTSTNYARQDHVHPTDTGRAALAGSAAQTFSVADATAANHAVALEQVHGAAAFGCAANTNGTSVSATSGTFTAPANGYLTIIAQTVTAANIGSIAVSVSASLAGLTTIYNNNSVAAYYLPMTKGQHTTITVNGSNVNSGYIWSAATAIFTQAP